MLLYAIVFTCRYLDLFVHFVSLYNSIMKIIYLIATYVTVYLIYVKFRSTYDRSHDSFRIELLILPACALAFVWNHEFSVLEVGFRPDLQRISMYSFQILWTFSIYLEAVAILPQLYMVTKTGEAETITSHYLFALGIYRFLYILNWIYRYYMENYLDWISIIAGVVQTILYCDFFYLYITRGKSRVNWSSFIDVFFFLVLRGRRLRLSQTI